MKKRIGLIAACANLAAAQFMVVQPAGPRADLWFELTASGEERAHLTAPAPLGNSIGDAFARAVGCQPKDLRPSPYDARVTVQCAVPRQSGGLHTEVKLADLAQRLESLGIQELELELSFPKMGGVSLTPDIPARGGYRTASFPVDAVPEQIVIDAGINPKHVRLLGAGALSLIVLPFILLLAKPRSLIHLVAGTQAVFLFGWAAWTWVLIETRAWYLCQLLSGNEYAAPALLLSIPLLAIWIGSTICASHYGRLAPKGANVELYRTMKFWIGAIVVFLFTAIFGIFTAPDEGPGFGKFAIAICGVLVAIVRLRLASRGASHPLGDGELRNRVAELAARAGARLRSITILTGSETRPPAAFATRWGGILLTDGLLQRLSKREVDAIVCHELSHTGPKSRGMMIAIYLVVVATVMTAQFVPETASLFPLAIVAAVLGWKALRRSEELAADRDSVRWSRDPEAMISGLARVSLASGMPLDWSAPMSWMLSHPPTALRLRMISQAGGISQSRLAELVDLARIEPADHYEQRSEVPPGRCIFPRVAPATSGAPRLVRHRRSVDLRPRVRPGYGTHRA